MKLLGLHRLNTFLSDNPRQQWISAWIYEVKSANWHRPEDVMSQFPSAAAVGPDLFRFVSVELNILIDMQVTFPHHIALILLATPLEFASDS